MHALRLSYTILALTLALALGACAVGPDYTRPKTLDGEQFKEASLDSVVPSDWQPAKPGFVDQSAWWTLFGDPVLNTLMPQLEAANTDIQIALARLNQARAVVSEARASFFPTVGTTEGISRGQTGGGMPVSNSYNARLTASWELDLFGGTRRSVESATESATASAADLADTLLSMRAELAQSYFQLRSLDEQIALYAETTAAYERSYTITSNRFAAGVVTRIDVAQAETQLKAAQAQAVELDLQRRQTEHAIAVLLGLPPSLLSLKPASLQGDVPPGAEAGLPSTLLERRPDIASAEHRMAAANAKIGVAVSAYFPTFSLGASGGYVAGVFDKWFTAPYRVWSLGPSLALSLFQGGALVARTDQAVAAWEAAVGTYRRTVLNAFREVEDQLAAAALLRSEARIQDQALTAARLAERLAMSQYTAGTTTYLTVATAQAAALNNARAAVILKGRRFVAAVALIRALGGGWSTAELQNGQVRGADGPDNGPDIQEANEP